MLIGCAVFPVLRKANAARVQVEIDGIAFAQIDFANEDIALGSTIPDREKTAMDLGATEFVLLVLLLVAVFGAAHAARTVPQGGLCGAEPTTGAHRPYHDQ